VQYDPLSIADLAAGTGKMASALHQQWPDARIVCEEPSLAMLEILQGRHPHFEVHPTSLQSPLILNQDLVTIAFNSLNYVQPQSLNEVFCALRGGMNSERILYFDVLTTESAMMMLGGNKELDKVRTRDILSVYTKLTDRLLLNLFMLPDGTTEEHVQFLVSEEAYNQLLYQNGFELLHKSPIPNTLRTEYYCQSR